MQILCEGPRCNGGRSAKDRERELVSDLPAQSIDLRVEAERHARSATSHALRLTEHEPIGSTRNGRPLYACADCGHERVYGGNTFWTPSV